MRIKIMVATALALAALGLKSLDSGKPVHDPLVEPQSATSTDVAWPRDKIGAESP